MVRNVGVAQRGRRGRAKAWHDNAWHGATQAAAAAHGSEARAVVWAEWQRRDSAAAWVRARVLTRHCVIWGPPWNRKGNKIRV